MNPGPGRRGGGDAGTGAVSTVAGITVVLAFLFLAVQLLTNLYATSVVTSAAHDGARMAAEADRDHQAPVVRREVEHHVRTVLGRYGERVELDWRGTTDDQVVLRVRADNPSLLLRSLGGELPFTRIDRTVRVRVEEIR